MRKIFAFLFVLISFYAVGQDTIVKKSGELLPSKIIAIDQLHVKYARMVNNEETVFEIQKSEVVEIRYGNGNKDVFNVVAPLDSIPPAKAVSPDNNDTYVRPVKEPT